MNNEQHLSNAEQIKRPCHGSAKALPYNDDATFIVWEAFLSNNAPP